ncbi:MAG: hypothetical protein PHW75_02240 [Patescibacteria group bacterium]|nr:hypothetical protein [Patescibacteria group bacterium]
MNGEKISHNPEEDTRPDITKAEAMAEAEKPHQDALIEQRDNMPEMPSRGFWGELSGGLLMSHDRAMERHNAIKEILDAEQRIKNLEWAAKNAAVKAEGAIDNNRHIAERMDTYFDPSAERWVECFRTKEQADKAEAAIASSASEIFIELLSSFGEHGAECMVLDTSKPEKAPPSYAIIRFLNNLGFGGEKAQEEFKKNKIENKDGSSVTSATVLLDSSDQSIRTSPNILLRDLVSRDEDGKVLVEVRYEKDANGLDSKLIVRVIGKAKETPEEHYAYFSLPKKSVAKMATTPQGKQPYQILSLPDKKNK